MCSEPNVFQLSFNKKVELTVFDYIVHCNIMIVNIFDLNTDVHICILS